ncbi:glutathione S-transferase [Mariannaea sp. PMI_226]|nr:glutathione S-transferase [Mariannaea sp. PMI_226]
MSIHNGPEDGWHGVVNADGQFPPEAGRYHLYIGLFCPYAQRLNIARHLKGLESVIAVSVVRPHPKGDANGRPSWQFLTDDHYEGATQDHLFGSKFLHQLYSKADPEYKGNYGIPVLWDTKTNSIVNNGSTEMLRWLPTAFDTILPNNNLGRDLDLYPAHLRAAIDEAIVWMERDLNLGVYKAGYAPTQQDYDHNVPTVFAALNKLEELIHRHGGPFVLGKELTELDIIVFATIIRFDVLYVQHFKLNLGTIRGNYPVIHEWMKNLYWNVDGFRQTTDFRHIKESYTKCRPDINPLAITPLGPFPNVEEGVELNFSKLKSGAVLHPAVIQRQKELYK